MSSGLSKAAIRFGPATLVAWLIGFVLLGSLDLAVAGAEPDRKPGSPPTVVILNSYHPGEAWTDNELAGLIPTLRRADPDLVPVIEYLDAKRFPGPDYLALLKEHLVRKYQGRRVDLLIVLDNPALDLVLKYRGDLFPGVPVVFAGINGFRPEWLQDRERMTGVAETQDMAGTLELALRLHPRTKNVLVVHDYTASGLAVRREVDAILPAFRDRVNVTFSPDVPFAELEQQLKSLPPDTVILLPTYVTDRDGQVFSREESTRRIADASPAPVYAMHETRLGHGIVGGLLLAGKEHGAQAGELALRVLAGEDPAQIPVENSHSRPQFDDVQLRRFRIDPGALPAGSTVINRPVSFYAQHRRKVWVALAVIALLSLVIVGLSLGLAAGQAGRAGIAGQRGALPPHRGYRQRGYLEHGREPSDDLRQFAHGRHARLFGSGHARAGGGVLHVPGGSPRSPGADARPSSGPVGTLRTPILSSGWQCAVDPRFRRSTDGCPRAVSQFFRHVRRHYRAQGNRGKIASQRRALPGAVRGVARRHFRGRCSHWCDPRGQ
ncbi:MAG: ABC transporter substrate binding protein [Candidatus Competibacter sp.]